MMFTQFFRWQYWRREAKLLLKRVARLEKELAEVRFQANAELWRNRAREDTFVSAAIMGSRGMWGVAPRTAPAEVEKPKQPAPTRDPYDLHGADLLEFNTFWKPDAEAAGVPMQEAKRKFVNEVVLPRLMPLNDDPFSGAN